MNRKSRNRRLMIDRLHRVEQRHHQVPQGVPVPVGADGGSEHRAAPGGGCQLWTQTPMGPLSVSHLWLWDLLTPKGHAPGGRRSSSPQPDPPPLAPSPGGWHSGVRSADGPSHLLRSLRPSHRQPHPTRRHPGPLFTPTPNTSRAPGSAVCEDSRMAAAEDLREDAVNSMAVPAKTTAAGGEAWPEPPQHPPPLTPSFSRALEHVGP